MQKCYGEMVFLICGAGIRGAGEKWSMGVGGGMREWPLPRSPHHVEAHHANINT